MRTRLFAIGCFITLFYILFLGWVTLGRLPTLLTMELNAVGDFLAGAVGPIAFLWLILGFIQQGQELKISSDALANQTEELRHSVDQQRTMAAINESQLRLNEKNAQLQNEQLNAAVEPRFVLKFRELENEHEPNDQHVLILLNAGHGITWVRYKLDDKDSWEDSFLESKAERFFIINNQTIGEDKDMVFKVQYLNGIQKEVAMSFNIRIEYRHMIRHWVRYVLPPNGKRIEVEIEDA